MRINIDYVKEGAILKEDVYDYNGSKLITAGSTVTKTILQKLKERQIKYLTIDITPEQEAKMVLDGDVLPSLDPILALETKRSVMELNVEKSEVPKKLKDILNNAETMVSNVIENSPLSYKLTDYKKHIESSDHAVRVAVFAVFLANEYNKNAPVPAQINLEEIATAALLHDIGECCINPKIRLSLGELPRLGQSIEGITYNQYEELSKIYYEKYVPYYSYCLLKDIHEISSVTKNMILLSREDETMSGPLKAKISASTFNKGDQNVIGAKIINLCSLYDSYLVQNIKESATLENVEVALLQALMDKKFDIDLIKMFLRAIPLYPLRTKVKLSGSKKKEDGTYEKFETYGMVVENFDDMSSYHRPKVITIPSEEIIDLRIEPSITITNIIGDEKKFSELYEEKTENLAYIPKK